MSSIEQENLDGVADIFLNVKSSEIVSVSLEVAISICGYSTEFLNLLSSLKFVEKSTEPIGKSAFRLCVFRKKRIPAFLPSCMRDLIEEFFFLHFQGSKTGAKLDFVYLSLLTLFLY
jgi:hypothetical protein